MKIDTDSMVSVSEANARGVSKLVSEAEAGKEWVILRGSKPAAAMIGMERLRRIRELEQFEQDADHFLTAACRVLTLGESNPPVSLAALLREVGLTASDLSE